MPDLVSTVLAKALVMLVEALVTRLALYLVRTGTSGQLWAAA
ncbi:hypothetical protein [Actinoallomurus spadix]|uniref:Uncharacterized protein n=1 Tax=Actinoallomurus spadix TaxID=79912 RepID=A0ABN0WAE1_9ACTN|nr:hypothetical protein [Actinoallomurus spadix]